MDTTIPKQMVWWFNQQRHRTQADLGRESSAILHCIPTTFSHPLQLEVGSNNMLNTFWTRTGQSGLDDDFFNKLRIMHRFKSINSFEETGELKEVYDGISFIDMSLFLFLISFLPPAFNLNLVYILSYSTSPCPSHVFIE